MEVKDIKRAVMTHAMAIYDNSIYRIECCYLKEIKGKLEYIISLKDVKSNSSYLNVPLKNVELKIKEE